jgi:replication factor A1
MGINFISELRPGLCSNTICVRVSRLWEYRGKNDEDQIKHLDMVLIDEKVHQSIYCFCKPAPPTFTLIISVKKMFTL